MISLGQRALGAQHLANRCGEARFAQKAVRSHPLVVEDLREISAAVVGQTGRRRSPRAAARATTRCAATSAVPDEPPTSSPSSRHARRVMRNDSLSETRSIRSIARRSTVAGKKSSPMPSTLYDFAVSPE